jgi:hypothetical protein
MISLAQVDYKRGYSVLYACSVSGFLSKRHYRLSNNDMVSNKQQQHNHHIHIDADK